MENTFQEQTEVSSSPQKGYFVRIRNRSGIPAIWSRTGQSIPSDDLKPVEVGK